MQDNLLGWGDSYLTLKNEVLDMLEDLIRRCKIKQKTEGYIAKQLVTAWLYSKIGVKDLSKSFKKLSREEYELAYDVCLPYCPNPSGYSL